MRLTHCIAAAGVATMLGAALVAPAGAAPTDPTARRQAAFDSAAREFGVPASVLLSVSYNETRWEGHGGAPSTSGEYGPMALADPAAAATGQRGDGIERVAGPQTLVTAAHLIGEAPATLRSSATANIRGGAALLARYEKRLTGSLPADAGAWYGAVAKYSGSTTSTGARRFADDVYDTIASGVSARTADGQRVALPARAVHPKTGQLSKLGLRAESATPKPECPRTLDCDFIPAAYQLNDPDDPRSYGNYDVADRPRSQKIDTIVLHDTEEYYDDAIDTFTNPASYVSAHYLVRSSDGHVTQFVRTKDVAWQAGDWYINTHSIGIEQEGFAIAGATWFTERLYRSTATLVRYLAAKYDVPLDRQHIIGHDNVPGIDGAHIPAMHWDPGPFWDWNHFMRLIGRPTLPTGGPHAPVVTINPRFGRNIQQVTDCEQHTDVAAQGSSFVWLRTGPSPDAPLFKDPGLHQDGGVAGTECAADWGDKASAGQQYVVAGRHGHWVAIWFDGAKVWFDGRHTSTPTSALVVRPKRGRSSVPTYGVAYPEASAYPSEIPPVVVKPLTYTILRGQSYVYGGRACTDYYYAKTIDDSLPGDHTVVRGHERYLRIQLGHRIGFVKASDVDVVPAVG